MLWIGVDPGVSGAVACISETGYVQTIRWTETWHDIVEWMHDVTDLQTCHALIEHVNAMPKQGVSSTFKFGQQFGAAEMLLTACEVPYYLVRPAKWQGEMGVQDQGR